jgi:hypothetical protein
MHVWLRRDAERLKGSLGIDLGCGKMWNRPLFKTERYIGVDVNQQALAVGLATYPDAIAQCSPLEDYRSSEPADLIICSLVLENKRMPHERTLPVIRHALSLLAPGGAFLFNIGKQNLPYEHEIDDLLSGRFKTVRKSVYGRFRVDAGFEWLSIAAAAILSRWPSLNVPRKDQSRRIYYACEGYICAEASVAPEFA